MSKTVGTKKETSVNELTFFGFSPSTNRDLYLVCGCGGRWWGVFFTVKHFSLVLLTFSKLSFLKSLKLLRIFRFDREFSHVFVPIFRRFQTPHIRPRGGGIIVTTKIPLLSFIIFSFFEGS